MPFSDCISLFILGGYCFYLCLNMRLFPFKCKGFCILRRNYTQENLWGRLGPAATLVNVWYAWDRLESLGEFGGLRRGPFPGLQLKRAVAGHCARLARLLAGLVPGRGLTVHSIKSPCLPCAAQWLANLKGNASEVAFTCRPSRRLRASDAPSDFSTSAPADSKDLHT